MSTTDKANDVHLERIDNHHFSLCLFLHVIRVRCTRSVLRSYVDCYDLRRHSFFVYECGGTYVYMCTKEVGNR